MANSADLSGFILTPPHTSKRQLRQDIRPATLPRQPMRNQKRHPVTLHILRPSTSTIFVGRLVLEQWFPLPLEVALRYLPDHPAR